MPFSVPAVAAPEISGLPENNGLPENTGFVENVGVPENAGVPVNDGVPEKTGLPVNAGLPVNTLTSRFCANIFQRWLEWPRFSPGDAGMKSWFTCCAKHGAESSNSMRSLLLIAILILRVAGSRVCLCRAPRENQSSRGCC